MAIAVTGDIGRRSRMEPAFKELLQKGRSLASELKLTEAIGLYQKWLKEDRPNSQDTPLKPAEKSCLAVAYNNLGQLKYLKVDFEGAVEDYNQAILYDPELAAAYYNRGTIMYRMGDFNGAVNDMEKATSLNPSNEEFKTGLERARLQLGGTS
ncbi:unnamed protein product [Allacma fusca]|uniref:Tetratricopeptide repeat protein n=1 Tax=Allacma fusca TaxID=39272 RepID=A0A8J2JXI4_9HEXA|nr:unnamed protein product [Allacma fusca]